jgi:hypothetical protein
MIKVSGFTFIPIQDDVPQKGRTKFIQLTNGMGEGDSNWSEEFYMPVDQPKTKKEVEAKEASAENDNHHLLLYRVEPTKLKFDQANQYLYNPNETIRYHTNFKKY